jgi:hypothetical protein
VPVRYRQSARSTCAVLALAAILAGASDTAWAQNHQRGRAATEAELRALIDQLNALTAAENARRQQAAAGSPLPTGCAVFRGPFIAPGVRNSIPVNDRCRTAAERQWVRRSNAETQNRMVLSQSRHLCEMQRDSQPYVTTRSGRDGIPLYQLRDGSLQRPGGTLNPGWYWTPAGPMRTACP